MITVKISCLLAFCLEPKLGDEKKKKKKGKKDKKKKSKKGKSSKSSKSSKKEKKSKPKKEVVKPKYMIEVGKPIGFAHIEYELFPGRPKYQVDVVCWGPVAKIFCVDGTYILKTVVQDNRAWVVICTKHVLNHFIINELPKLHKHVVNYSIWTSKNKLSASAKSEKAKVFYIYEKDIGCDTKFTKAFSADPNIQKFENEEEERLYTLQEDIKNILWEYCDRPGTKYYEEIVTRLDYTLDPVHEQKIYKIINNVAQQKEIKCKDFVPICPPPMTDEDLNKMKIVKTKKDSKKDKKGKGKKDKKKKKEKKQSKKGKGKKDKEVFFTDPDLTIFNIQTENPYIINGYIVLTIINLLTRMQKYVLNPLVIKIKKLNNVPVDILKEHRFTTIYANYNVPYIARCKTIEKSITNDIRFNESHVHFIDNTVPKQKFIEFLQTQRLYVEIRGVRDPHPPTIQTNIFGTEKEDEDICKRLTPHATLMRLNDKEEPTDVLLAVVCFDISSLLKPVWDFLENNSCHYPDNMFCKKFSSLYENFGFVDIMTANEINMGFPEDAKCYSPLKEYILTDYGTSLKVEVYLNAPQACLLHVQASPTVLQRLFVVVDDENIAKMLLNKILLHNQWLLGPQIIVPNCLHGHNLFSQNEMKNIVLEPDSVNTSADNILTGFLIDNGGSYGLFIEGLASGFIIQVWNDIMHVHRSILKLFYNSDLIFEKRLYAEFTPYGGIYSIILKMPLENIISQELFYVKGNVPIPCWEALKKLSLLFSCPTLATMMQFCLFPTSKQLLSVGLEWGVPLAWNQDFSKTTQLKNANGRYGTSRATFGNETFAKTFV